MCSGSNHLRGAVCNKNYDSNHQQDESKRTREIGGQYLASMFLVEFSPGGEFNLIFRFDPLFAIPPGTATVQITSNVRGADNRHSFSPPGIVCRKYSTNFLISSHLKSANDQDVFINET